MIKDIVVDFFRRYFKDILIVIVVLIAIVSALNYVSNSLSGKKVTREQLDNQIAITTEVTTAHQREMEKIERERKANEQAKNDVLIHQAAQKETSKQIDKNIDSLLDKIYEINKLEITTDEPEPVPEVVSVSSEPDLVITRSVEPRKTPAPKPVQQAKKFTETDRQQAVASAVQDAIQQAYLNANK